MSTDTWLLWQACDPRHPEYSDTRQLCEDEGIDHTLTRYRWRVAAPSGVGGSALRDIQPSAFFASTHLVTLDSVYFRAGQQVHGYVCDVTLVRLYVTRHDIQTLWHSQT